MQTFQYVPPLNDEYFKNLLSPRHFKDKIRLGRNGDGGYVVSSKHLTKHLISVGCGGATTFEEDYINHAVDCKVDIYDGNVNQCDSAQNSKVKFYNHNVYSLNDLNINEPCMIQMDIEGAELSFFDNYDKMPFIEQLVIEIHFHEEKAPEFPIIGDYIQWYNLFKTFDDFFSLIHIHVNSWCLTRPLFFGMCDCLELTYIKKDHSLNLETRPFPIENLDFPNAHDTNIYLDWWINNIN